MRWFRIFGICALFLACLALVYSCSQSPTESQSQASQSDIPANVMQIAQEHSMPFAPVPDGISKFTPSSTIYNPPYDNYDLYSVTLLWGELYSTSDSSAAPIDWSGQASINGVAVIDVVYQIDFEDGEDSLIQVDSPAHIAWASQAGDLDGISMLIYLDRDITYITAPKLTIQTAQINLDFDFGELENFADIYNVSNTQAMVVVARRILSADCPSGTMVGEWVRDNVGGQTGTLHGKWFENSDTPAGLFNGQFEWQNNGVGVFSGQVSGYVADQVIYRFKGSWYYDDPRMCPLCGSGHGKYQGVFSDTNGMVVGVIKGQFGYAPDAADNNLPLQGNWRKFCNDVSPNDHTPANVE